MSDLGERLRHARALRRLSQQELARKADVSQQLISQLERGDTVVSARHIALARALEVSLDWLVDGHGEMGTCDDPLIAEIMSELRSRSKKYLPAVLAMLKALP